MKPTRSFGTALILFGVLTAFAAGLLASQTRAQDARTGQWIIDTTRGTNQYRLTLSYSPDSGRGTSITSSNLAPDRLQGLTGAQIMSAGAHVQFQLVRDAGTFNCEGWFREGKGSGHFVFTGSPTVVAELHKRGINSPNELRERALNMSDADLTFKLALHDVTLAFIDELNAQGYYRPTPVQLVRMGEHGVSLDYLLELKALGYSVKSPDLLIRIVDHGVSASLIKELDALGFKQLPVETLIRTVDHGVSPRFINELAAAGYTGLTLEQLTKSVDHGVTVKFIKEIEALGYIRPTLEQLVKMQDHGVTPKFINGLKELGFQNLAIEQLIRMRDHGVNAAFIMKMRSRGFNETSIDELIRLADHGSNN